MGRDFSRIGRALATPARALIVDALMDGSTRPAGELAAIAGVSASTASEHLAILVDSGLLRAEQTGRQRRYRIVDQPTADALESLGHLCPTTQVRSLRQSRTRRDLAHARLCYDHLAGRLGVRLLRASTRLGWFDPGLCPTDTGLRALAQVGLDMPSLRARRRPLTRACPDWTERRPHLAGALGADIATLFLDRGWVRRRPTGRGLIITDPGADALHRIWELDSAT